MASSRNSYTVTYEIPQFFCSQKVCIRTTKGKYLRAGLLKGFTLSSSLHSRETFIAHRLDDGCITFKTWNGAFLSASPPNGNNGNNSKGGVKIKQRRKLGEREKFRVIPVGVMYAIQSHYGTYVSANPTSGRVGLSSYVEDNEMFDILAI